MERIDYFGALRAGWEITWKHKILWLLGLLYAGFGGSGTRREVSEEAAQESWRQTTQWISANVGLAIGIGLVGLLVVIAFVVISLSAQGGLIWAANEGAEGRKPTFGDAFRAGYRKAGRTFMIGFLTGLPIFLMALAFVGTLIAAGVGTALLEGDPAAALVGICGTALLGVVALVAVGIIVSAMIELGVRYGVLADYTFGRAITRAWHDVWGKRGAVVFLLLWLLIGLVLTVAITILTSPFTLLLDLDTTGTFGILGLITAFVGAVYAAFYSASWTVFFRRMTGMERPAPVPQYPTVAPPYPPATPGYPGYPPAPQPPVMPVAPVEPGPIVDVASPSDPADPSGG